jgi:hypothetical protein
MTARTYRRRPIEVAALRFDGSNAHELAAWCGGRVVLGSNAGDAVLIQVGPVQVAARVGQWVVCESLPRGECRFFTLSAVDFEFAYIEATTASLRTTL